jgi:hypothetical protein
MHLYQTHAIPLPAAGDEEHAEYTVIYTGPSLDLARELAVLWLQHQGTGVATVVRETHVLLTYVGHPSREEPCLLEEHALANVGADAPWPSISYLPVAD